jgi:hypothetical protein
MRARDLGGVAACTAALLTCAVLVGCGSESDGGAGDLGSDGKASAPPAPSVPTGAVAMVGDTPISKERFDRWFNRALDVIGAGGAQGPPVTPDFPEFPSCVAAQKKTGATTAEGRSECRAVFDQIMPQVMPALIQAEWTLRAAEAEDLTITAAELEKRSRAIGRSMRKPAEGAPVGPDGKPRIAKPMSERDIRFQARVSTLQAKLTDEIAKVGDADIREYFDEHRGSFIEPDRREMRFVSTRSRAEAKRAKRRLDAGESFAAVRRDLSGDGSGGTVKLDRAPSMEGFEKAAFEAGKGEIEGPVEDDAGWYVFEVVKVEPGGAVLSAVARQRIRGILQGEREKTLVPEYFADVAKRFRAMTVCREGFVVPLCGDTDKS